MRPSVIVEYMARLYTAKTIPELKERYVQAYKAAQASADIQALERFTQIKDARKKQLTDEFNDSQEAGLKASMESTAP